jgi:hypothetical protein
MRFLVGLGVAVGLLAAAGYGVAQDLAPKPLVQQPPGVPGLPGVPAIRSGLDVKEVIPPLVDALKDSDTEVRRSAAGALAHLGQPAVAPLLEILKDKDKDRELRANVAYVLGQMGTAGQDAVPTLLKLLKDDDRDLRRRAAYAVQNIIKASSDSGMMMPGTVPGGGIAGPPGAFGGGFGIGRPASPAIRVTDPGVVPGSDGGAAPVRSGRGEKKEENPEKKEEEKK